MLSFRELLHLAEEYAYFSQKHSKHNHKFISMCTFSYNQSVCRKCFETFSCIMFLMSMCVHWYECVGVCVTPKQAGS